MAEDNTPNPQADSSSGSQSEPEKKSMGNVWWFVGLSIVCALVAWCVMDSANTRLEKTHELIIAHHANSATTVTRPLLNLYKEIASDSLKLTDPKAFERFSALVSKATSEIQSDQTNQRIANLLESEYAKIQSEYEILNLWCALLTVVFLIFSFFSIFKANEMANQSEDALKTMRSVAREVQSKSDTIDSKISDADRRISKTTNDVTTLEGKYNSLNSKIDSLKDTKIPELERTVDTAKDNFNANFNEKLAEFNAATESITQRVADSLAEKAEEKFNEEKRQLLDRVATLESQISLAMRSLDNFEVEIANLKQESVEIGEEDEDDEIGEEEMESVDEVEVAPGVVSSEGAPSDESSEEADRPQRES
ncbi:MAG: hypothetical protein NC453_08830 [Muribaculum sp.]|nr:hypothetical protein [Muribaculum sp.]